MGAALKYEEAEQHLLNGGRLRVFMTNGNHGVVLIGQGNEERNAYFFECHGGFSEGVTEQICDTSSSYLKTFLDYADYRAI